MNIYAIVNILFWVAVGSVAVVYLWKQKFWKKFRSPRKNYVKYTDVQSERPLSDEDFLRKKKAEKEYLDAILDKISHSGYEKLTPEEKDFLFRQSNSKS